MRSARAAFILTSTLPNHGGTASVRIAASTASPDLALIRLREARASVTTCMRRAPRFLIAVIASGSLLTPASASIDLPPIDRVIHYQPKLPLQVVTADGVEIAQFGAERRIYKPLAEIPKLMQDALLAIEDSRFREHGGVDPRGVARAVLSMITGGRRQGASTITQQLTRTMLLSQEKTLTRKAKEIVLAMRIEEALPKDRILEIYMNEIFLGQRAYGFAAAAQTYFGKPLDKLSVAEVAMLAGLPQNPYYANPVTHLERAVQRQRVVLKRMREVGVIDDAQLAAARSQKLVIRSPGQRSVVAGHVAEMARLAVVQRFGEQAYSSGIKVVTSLRAADQQAAQLAVRHGLMAHDRKQAWRGPEDTEPLPAALQGVDLERAAAQALKEHRDDDLLRVAIVLAASPRELRVQLATGEQVSITGPGLRVAQSGLAPKARAAMAVTRGAVLRVTQQGKTWAVAQWPLAQAGFVALHTTTGRVRALVGSFDFSRQPFNHVTQAHRQPGSSFKPFIYSAALEHGFTPATVIDDTPFVSADGWTPGNSDGLFDGPLTLREALAKSKNMVSIRIVQQLGTGTVRDWASRFGLDATQQPDNLTLALGAGSATPLQMAQAYAVFANGGHLVMPVLIERIVDASGKVLFEAPAAPTLGEATRVIPERNAFVMRSLLNDVTRVGTAARAQSALGRPDVYGKTGTTNEAVDAWFAGFQPGVSAVAWMGYSDNRSLGDRESGGGLALPIWIDALAAMLKRTPVAPVPGPVPTGLVRQDTEWLYEEAARPEPALSTDQAAKADSTAEPQQE
jgi:penicillin-binding protein 1A